jgi:hypothetical protein
MTNPTTPFGWQMPTSTDLVTDLPADFEVFGQAVATSMADLLGGASGYILSKSSATDMDFTWIPNDQGDITGITATTPLTGGGTSGAVTVGIQDGTTAQKGAVQLSDSISTTDSTIAATATAAKAAYDNGGVRQQTAPISGNYYLSPDSSISTTNNAVVNVTYYLPIFVPVTTTFDRIACMSSPTFSGSASIRLGLYNNVNGAPGTVLLDAGTVAITAASTMGEITISQSLAPGIYFMAANTVTAATTNNYYVYNNTAGNPLLGATRANISTANSYRGFTQSVNVSAGFATAVSPSLSTTLSIMTAIRAA